MYKFKKNSAKFKPIRNKNDAVVRQVGQQTGVEQITKQSLPDDRP